MKPVPWLQADGSEHIGHSDALDREQTPSAVQASCVLVCRDIFRPRQLVRVSEMEDFR